VKKKLTLVILMVFCLLNIMVYAETPIVPTEVLSNDYYTNDKINYKFKLPVDWNVTEQINEQGDIYSLRASSKDNYSVLVFMSFKTNSILFTEDIIRQNIFLNDPTYSEISKETVIINNKEITLYNYTNISPSNIKLYTYNIVFKDKQSYNAISVVSTEQLWQKNKDIYKQVILSVYGKNSKTVDLNNIDKNLNIKTTKSLLSYYNNKMKTLDTPMGKWQFEYKILDNDSATMPYDFWIQTEWIKSELSPYKVEYSLNYTDEQKKETRKLLREFQMKVAETAMYYFPDKKIEGGFYWGYYRYPTLRVDYRSVKFLSWQNYGFNMEKILDADVGLYNKTKLDAFRWNVKSDDYDFTE
jgi:hypothetical protein